MSPIVPILFPFSHMSSALIIILGPAYGTKSNPGNPDEDGCEGESGSVVVMSGSYCQKLVFFEHKYSY